MQCLQLFIHSKYSPPSLFRAFFFLGHLYSRPGPVISGCFPSGFFRAGGSLFLRTLSVWTLGVAGTGFRRGTLVCNDDWPLQGVTRPLLLPPASGSPVAPANGQRWAERADREGVGRPAPPGNLVTGALATGRGRDLGRKSEAGGYISREFLLRANSKCPGTWARSQLVTVQVTGARGDPGGPGHLYHPAMETSAQQEQQQPVAAKIRNLPW